MRRSAMGWMAVAFLTASGASCLGSEPTEDVDAAATVVIPTTNPQVALGRGFSPLFDQAGQYCVRQDVGGPAVEPPRTGGGEDRRMILTSVSSREDLARNLGIDLGLKVRYQAISADAAVSMVQSFKGSRTTVSLLLKAAASYTISTRGSWQMTEENLTTLQGSMPRFLRECGSHFVTGIRYEGRVFVLLQYDAGSTERADQIKSQLGISSANPAVPVEGSLKTQMDNTMSAQDVQFTLQVISEGFLDSREAATGQPPAQSLSGVTLTQANLASISNEIDSAYRALLGSVARDACRDLGPNRDGTPNLCDGAPSPGYQNNTVRHSRVAGVELSTYDPSDETATQNYLRLLRRLDEVEDFARLHGQIENKIEDVVSMELEPFLAGSPVARARYNVAPPGAPVYSLTELSDLGEHWYEIFRSRGVDNVVDPLQDAVGVCWREAAMGEFTNCPRCTMDDLDGCHSLDVAIKRLGEYQNASRILPLEFVAVSQQVDWGWARRACEGRGMMLPDVNQIPYLALAVAQGASAFCDPEDAYCSSYGDSDRLYYAWYDPVNGTQDAGCLDKDATSWFYNPPNQPPAASGAQASHWRCQDPCHNFLGIGCPNDDAAIFCINPGGPFGRIPVIL